MLKVNGELVDAAGKTVVELLAMLGYQTKFVAVECDGSIIPRADWDSKILTDDAVIEVVRFVGGG